MPTAPTTPPSCPAWDLAVRHLLRARGPTARSATAWTSPIPAGLVDQLWYPRARPRPPVALPAPPGRRRPPPRAARARRARASWWPAHERPRRSAPRSRAGEAASYTPAHGGRPDRGDGCERRRPLPRPRSWWAARRHRRRRPDRRSRRCRACARLRSARRGGLRRSLSAAVLLWRRSRPIAMLVPCGVAAGRRAPRSCPPGLFTPAGAASPSSSACYAIGSWSERRVASVVVARS